LARGRADPSCHWQPRTGAIYLHHRYPTVPSAGLHNADRHDNNYMPLPFLPPPLPFNPSLIPPPRILPFSARPSRYPGCCPPGASPQAAFPKGIARPPLCPRRQRGRRCWERRRGWVSSTRQSSTRQSTTRRWLGRMRTTPTCMPTSRPTAWTSRTTTACVARGLLPPPLFPALLPPPPPAGTLPSLLPLPGRYGLRLKPTRPLGVAPCFLWRGPAGRLRSASASCGRSQGRAGS